MLTAKQYFGDPIDCFVQGVDKSLVTTYCWVHGTYTVVRHDKYDISFNGPLSSYYYVHNMCILKILDL